MYFFLLLLCMRGEDVPLVESFWMFFGNFCFRFCFRRKKETHRKQIGVMTTKDCCGGRHEKKEEQEEGEERL